MSYISGLHRDDSTIGMSDKSGDHSDVRVGESIEQLGVSLG